MVEKASAIIDIETKSGHTVSKVETQDGEVANGGNFNYCHASCRLKEYDSRARTQHPVVYAARVNLILTCDALIEAAFTHLRSTQSHTGLLLVNFA